MGALATFNTISTFGEVRCPNFFSFETRRCYPELSREPALAASAKEGVGSLVCFDVMIVAHCL